MAAVLLTFHLLRGFLAVTWVSKNRSLLAALPANKVDPSPVFNFVWPRVLALNAETYKYERPLIEARHNSPILAKPTACCRPPRLPPKPGLVMDK